MKRLLKIVAAVVLLLVVAVAAFVGSLFVGAATPPKPVGFQEVIVPDTSDKPLAVGIWYPTDSSPGRSLIGLSAQRVATNGNVSGHDLPLVIISHGNGGLFSSHSDTALALAADGFVVAAVTHTGDNVNDQSYVGTQRWLIDRSRHVHVVLDYMLRDWAASKQVDPAHVGIFGFSAGATTALLSVGATLDFGRLTEVCKARPEFACTLWKQLPTSNVAADTWVHDDRFKAAVIAAPGYGFAFDPASLSNISLPVQLWNGSDDKNVPYASNEAIVRQRLARPPEYHSVPNAGHFAFLAPCPSWLLPVICKDDSRFDRADFHREFNDSVRIFFRTSFGLK